MRTIHVLRKLNPAEWGGTETALERLFEGLRLQGVAAVAYCPRLETEPAEPWQMPGCEVRRFRAFVPVAGLSRQRRRQMVSVGGNLMSFDLGPALWRERNASVIHAHTLGRIGGLARLVARRRRLPFVVSVHGGVLDLPESLRKSFNEPAPGWEWGKCFGWLLRARRVLSDADAIITCNEREAGLLRKSMPDRRVVVLPHGVPLEAYLVDHREAALRAFPVIRGRRVLLSVGRIDPVKNQGWLLEQAAPIFQRHPDTILVLAGACTDEPYGGEIARQLQRSGFSHRVLLTGGLPSGDPRLIGLFQNARAVLLPSRSETFGLVILEAWAAGAPVLSSRTSGPSALIESGRNGWLFDLDQPQEFHEALDSTLADEGRARGMAARGAKIARQHSLETVAGRLKDLYQQLLREKVCAT